MTPDRFISCPQDPDRKCTLPYCLANPKAPACIQANRGIAGRMTNDTTPDKIGDQQGPMYRWIVKTFFNK